MVKMKRMQAYKKETNYACRWLLPDLQPKRTKSSNIPHLKPTVGRNFETHPRIHDEKMLSCFEGNCGSKGTNANANAENYNF